MSIVTTARFQSYLATNPWSPSTKPSEVVSFKLLPDSRTLVLVMRGGDIATASLEDELPIVREFECVFCVVYAEEESCRWTL